MLQGIVVLALIGTTLAYNSANQFVDNILQSAFPAEIRALGLDPAPLPDFNVNFGYRSVYDSVGEAHFRNGNATGFSRFTRKGDCQGRKTVAGQYSINCTLTLFPFLTNYNALIRNGSNIYVIRNMGHIAQTLIDIKIVGQIVGHLKSFDIARLGQINPTYHGLPQSLLIYTKVISDEYKTVVSTNLFNMLRDRVKYAFQRALINRPLPRP